ncbi:MAG: 4Fe-4S binding protein, partial [Bacillota bacterium]|nr:4Fe-4S binding protein [Bacillota bacterium]
MEKKIRAMYFSGTNTTAKVTTDVAYRMWQNMDKTEHKIGVSGATDDKINYVKAENVNFTPLAAREKRYVFDENDILVFGTPVIAGRVPNVLLKFLDTLEGGGAMAVPVVLYGNRNFDDALMELRNILEAKGFHTVAAAAFIGEHSFSKTLAAGRPDIEDMNVAAKFADRVSEKILSIIKDNDGDNEKIRQALMAAGPIKVDGQEPLRPYYQPQDRKGNPINILKVKPKVDREKCTGCGMCVDACPMGSIKAEAPGHVDGICIKCC